MSKTYEQVIEELDAKIPREAVSIRDGGGGRELSYLQGWYVIDRLNKVLGHSRWAYQSEVTPVHSGVVKDRYGKDVFTQHYIARVRLLYTLPDGTQNEYSDYGYGDGSDKTNPGKAHELAVKEAVTDGLKRCAKNLGMSMGLGLYDKAQENVEDTNGTSKVVREGASIGDQGGQPGRGEVIQRAGGESERVQPNEKPSSKKPTKEQIFEAITDTSYVAIAKKKVTIEDLKAKLKNDYGVDNKEQLAYPKAQEFLTYLKGVVNA